MLIEYIQLLVNSQGKLNSRLCAAFTVECDHSHNRLYWKKPCGNSGNDTVSQTDGSLDFTVCLAWSQKSHYRPTIHCLLSSLLPLLSLGSISFFLWYKCRKHLKFSRDI